MARRPKKPLATRPIQDSETLTHYGTTTEEFRNEPRWATESELSLIVGGVDPLLAGDIVRPSGALNDGTDSARYTTAGALRAEGFDVRHSPTRRNPDHVSVGWPGDWTMEVSIAFDSCFTEIEVADPPNADDEEVDDG